MKWIVLSIAGAMLLFAGVPMPSRASVQQDSEQQPSKPQTNVKMFTGIIVKNGENFVLNDSADKMSYVLDDAKKASQFEGKTVKVTGTVDVASNTIHVETIVEIA